MTTATGAWASDSFRGGAGFCCRWVQAGPFPRPRFPCGEMLVKWGFGGTLARPNVPSTIALFEKKPLSHYNQSSMRSALWIHIISFWSIRLLQLLETAKVAIFWLVTQFTFNDYFGMGWSCLNVWGMSPKVHVLKLNIIQLSLPSRVKCPHSRKHSITPSLQVSELWKHQLFSKRPLRRLRHNCPNVTLGSRCALQYRRCGALRYSALRRQHRAHKRPSCTIPSAAKTFLHQCTRGTIGWFVQSNVPKRLRLRRKP